MRHAVTLAIIAALTLPSAAKAQSLAEAAAKEKEKRKNQPAPKVLTEDDLRRAGRSGNANVDTGAAAPASAASPAPGKDAAPAKEGAAGAKKEKTEDEIRAEQQTAWREKLKKAQDDVQRLSQLSDQIQKHLNDMTGNLYGGQRTALMSDLEKTKADLQAAQQQVTTIEEEGRRNRYQ